MYPLMMPVLEELDKDSAAGKKGKQKLEYASKHDFILNLYDATRTYEFDPEGIRVIQAFQQRDFFSRCPRTRLGL